MGENPGAYHEARNRIRENTDREKISLEKKRRENFEISKMELRKKNNLDVTKLRGSIMTGNSLESLKSEIKNALAEGIISRDTYNQVIASIEEQSDRNISYNSIDVNRLPFSQNALAQYFEKKPFGESIGSDIVGFLYGFIIQGSAILIIIAWKILTDFLFLPRDIYKKLTQ